MSDGDKPKVRRPKKAVRVEVPVAPSGGDDAELARLFRRLVLGELKMFVTENFRHRVVELRDARGETVFTKPIKKD